MQSLLLCLFIAGIVAVLYFSWLPYPNLGKYGYLPRWLSRWTDTNANMNTRTAVPFTFLGMVSGFRLLLSKLVWYRWLTMWLILVLLVFLAEVGQLLLTLRHFDWGDIIWGAAGAFIGMIIMIPMGLLLKRIET